MVKPSASKNETKEQKFKRIAASRTYKVLRHLKLLGNCSNKSTYSYSKADLDKIFDAINKELRRVKSLFDKPKEHEFSLNWGYVYDS